MCKKFRLYKVYSCSPPLVAYARVDYQFAVFSSKQLPRTSQDTCSTSSISVITVDNGDHMVAIYKTSNVVRLSSQFRIYSRSPSHMEQSTM